MLVKIDIADPLADLWQNAFIHLVYLEIEHYAFLSYNIVSFTHFLMEFSTAMATRDRLNRYA